MKRSVSLLMLLYLWLGTIYAQQDPQFTQYMYNTNIINPAYAGTQGDANITTLYRAQWVGLDGAPETQTFNLNTPLLLRQRGLTEQGLGLGLSFVNDNIGPSSEQFLAVDFSYRIQTSENTSLSFGLKAGGNLLNVDFTQLQIFDPTEETFAQNIESRFTPNIGAGIYYYSERWYTGASVPNLLETEHYDDIQQSTAKERQTFYFIGGYVFEMSPDFLFKPAFLTRITSGAPASVDLSANFIYRNQLTLGASYRIDAAVSALAGFQINPTWFIGYAYDMDTTRLGNFNGGSHELFMRIDLNWFGDKLCGCPRLF